MKINQLKIGVVLSYIYTGINMIINLTYTPLMIRILGQSEYGLYTLVGSVVSYLSLFNLGFTGAYLRFYSRYAKDDDQENIAELNAMFLTVFAIMSLLAIVCGFILAEFTPQIFGDKLSIEEMGKAKVLMRILVVNIALTFPSSLFASIVSAHEQFLFQRIVSLIGIIFNPLVCLPLLFLGFGSVAMVSVTTFITIGTLIVNIFFCLKKMNTKFKFGCFNFGVLKEIGAFSFFLFINMIIDQINWNVDKFILGRVSGTNSVAIYGVGAQINTLYTVFSTSISSVFAPRVNMIAARNQKSMKKEFTSLFTKVGRIQFLVLTLIAIGFIVFGQYFITNIYATSDYGMSYYVALFLILPVTIPLIQNLGIEIQRSVNKHKFRSLIYFIMAIVNVALSIPLSMMFGPVGAAMGTAVSLIVANGIIMNIYYYKALGIDVLYFWKSILRLCRGIIIPIILGVVIMVFVPFTNLFIYLLIILIFSVIYIASMWFLGMNRYEKDLFLKPIKKVQNIAKSKRGIK